MNTATFPLMSEGAFCRRGGAELKINDLTCHCRTGEGD